LQFKHIIFDCDGVLVDSEPLSMRADVALLRQFGVNITEQEAHHRFVGKTFQAMLEDITAATGLTFPVGLSAEKDRMLAGLYHAELKAVEDMGHTLKILKDRRLSFSVASNSPKERVELALELTGMDGFFDAITTFEEVENGKPAPDVFFRAQEKSGVSADQCLVVEDSVTGVTAARAAGLRTCGFTGTHAEPAIHNERLIRVGADPVLHRMADLLLFV
jgi:HAD superfamily hydrolase (TIGR01509 family)